MNCRRLMMLGCLLPALLLAGCWDYVDMDRRGVSLAIGVDAVQPTRYQPAPKLRVTVEVANPGFVGDGGRGSGSSGTTQDSLIIAHEAASLIEALELVEHDLDRHLYLSFLQSIVIGERLARSGIGGVFDLIHRDPNFKLTVCLFITPASPETILKFNPVIGASPGMWLRAVAENFRDTPKLMPCVPVWKYRKEITDMGATLLPRVDWLAESRRPFVEGAAVMLNHQLVGWLSPLETEGAHWWRDRVQGGVINIPCPGGGTMSLEVRKTGRSQFRFGGRPPDLFLTLRLQARAAIREIGSGCSMLGEEASTDPNVLQAVADAVRHRAEAALQAARHLQTDFLHIGRQLRLQDPDGWRRLGQGRVHVPELVNIPVYIEVIPAIAEYGRHRW